SEAEGSRAEEEDRRAADLRILGLLLRRSFRGLAARRELHDDAPEELESVIAAQRMESAASQFLAATRQHLGFDVRHGAEESGVQLHLLSCLDEPELGHGLVEGPLDPLQQDGMADAALVLPLPAEDAV